jgi:hypothetical protein
MAVKIPYQVNDNVGGGQLANLQVIAPDFAPLARGVQALGDSANEYFGRLQDERNVATAKEIDAKLSMAVDFRTAEASEKRGKDSIGVTKSAAEQLEMDIAGLSEEYKDNAFAQKYLSNQSKGATAHLYGTVLNHETKEVMAHSQQASEQQLSVETSRIVNDSLTAGSFDTGLARNEGALRNAVKEYARVKGVDENAAFSAVMTEAVTSFAISADPQAVTDALNNPKYVGVIDEKTRQTLLEKAKDDKNYLDATVMGGDLYLSGASETDVLRQARERFPKDARAQSVVMGGFAQALGAQRREEAEYDRGMRETVNTALSEGKPLSPEQDKWYRSNTGKDPNKVEAKDPTAQDYLIVNNAQAILTRKLMTARTEGDRIVMLNEYEQTIGKSVNQGLHQSAIAQGAKILEASKNPTSSVSFVETSNRVASQLNAQGFGIGKDKARVDAQADIITVMLNQRTDGYLPDGSPNPKAVSQAYALVKDVKKSEAGDRIKDEMRIGEENAKAMLSLGVDITDTGFKKTPLQQWLDSPAGRGKEGDVLSASDALRKVYGRRPNAEQVYDFLRRKKIIKDK